MKAMNWYVLIMSMLALWSACSPKTGQPTVTPPTTPKNPTPPAPPPAANLSPCPKFKDAPNPDEAETNYVLYRDHLKKQQIDKAFELWQKVYQVAPAADGRRATVFEDGIWFYKRIYNGAEDSILRKQYLNTVIQLFDEMAKCYGEKEWVGARKAFEYYYSFQGTASKMEIYNLFKTYIDTAGLKTQAFAINPFTALLVELGLDKQVPMKEAQHYDKKIKEILTHNLANAKPQELEAWKIVDSYAPARLTDFETMKGFYDCAYFKERYLAAFQENPKDCDVIRETFSWLKWGGCPDADEDLKTVVKAGNENCVERLSCYQVLKNGNYREAIACFEEAIDKTSSTEEKAAYTLLIAKIYYSHLKNYGQARKYARDASKIRPNWGEPYLLVGRLYASSGPLCGPGTGWDSQVVTWVAIDEWSKAKSVDPSSAAEANKLIGRYSQFMPSREEIFQRNLKSGDTYFIGCWIQQNTTIRPAP